MRPVLIAVFFLSVSIGVNASWPEGHWYWSTKFGRDILIFGANDHLVFQSDYTIDDEKKSYRLFGSWKSQPGVCRSDDKKSMDEGNTSEGNLVIYIDSTQCCLQAEQLENKLVLTKVWVKGSGLALHAYCSDHALIPFEPPSN